MPDTIDLPTLERAASAIGQFCWSASYTEFCARLDIDQASSHAAELWHALHRVNDDLKVLRSENALRAIVATAPPVQRTPDEA